MGQIKSCAKYTFMHDHIAQYAMRSLCAALSVSRSGYYAWRKRGAQYTALNDTIIDVHTRHKTRVSAPSIHAELVESGVVCSVRTVGRRMRLLGLRGSGCRKFKRRTDSGAGLYKAPNLLERQFKTEQPNQVWVSDIDRKSVV